MIFPPVIERVKAPIVILVGLLLFGMTGYTLIEHWPLLDSFYMTVITLSTVGYGEIHNLSAGGRFFTIILIFASFGSVGYAFTKIASFIIEGEMKRILEGKRMHKCLNQLENHTILCGAGSTGWHIAEEFLKIGKQFVVVDINQEAIEDLLKIVDIPYVCGDATEDETLKLAGIDRAETLVTVLSDDKDNSFVALCAKSLNSNLRVVARLVDEQNAPKLIRAGADEVVSPSAIGGLRMASLVLRPSVVNFFDSMMKEKEQTLRVEEIIVSNYPKLIGKTLKEINLPTRVGLLVLSIKSPEHGFQFNPNEDAILREHDIIIVSGPVEGLNKLKDLSNN